MSVWELDDFADGFRAAGKGVMTESCAEPCDRRQGRPEAHRPPRTSTIARPAGPGRAWCDFASYDPRVPDDLKLFVVRVPRDDDAIADLEAQTVAFLAEVADQVARLEALGRRALISSQTREAA